MRRFCLQRCCSPCATLLVLVACLSIPASFTLVMGTLFVHTAFAQEPQPSVRFSAQLDTTKLLIGMQTILRLRAEYPKGSAAVLPSIADTLGSGVEVVERGSIDSSEHEGMVSQEQAIVITSFTPGTHTIEPFTLAYTKPGALAQSTIFSPALNLTVDGMAIDSSQGLKDIKAPLDVPLSFMEVLPYIIVGVLVIAALVGGVYYFHKRPAKPRAELAHQQPRRPAHEVALESLERLKQERLWQKGQVKEYHTQLADIIRTYLEHAYSIKTLEVTSDEILRQYQRHRTALVTAPGSSELLRFVLSQADMVKFARFQPLPEDNEKALHLAIEFVNLTLPSLPEDL